MTLAVGNVFTKNNCKRAICLMTAQAANNNPPTLATDGVPNYPTDLLADTEIGAGYANRSAEASTLLIRSTAGSGVMVGTFVLWGYLAASATWYPIKVNGGTALAEYSADLILYREVFTYLGHFDRLYLELQGVGGTSTAFESFLLTARQGM